MLPCTLLLGLASLSSLAYARLDGQQNILAVDHAVPQTISVQVEATHKQTADAVTVQLLLNQTASSSSALAQILDSDIAALRSSYMTITSRSHSSEEDLEGFTAAKNRNKGLGVQEDDGFTGTAHASASFTDLEQCARFNASFVPGTTVEWLNWELSPALEAVARTASRREALRKAGESGREYAELFGRELRLVAFDQSSIWTGADAMPMYYGQSWMDDEDAEVDWTPGMVSVHFYGTAKFELVA